MRCPMALSIMQIPGVLRHRWLVASAFLGAGAILQGKGRVHGLTTAASLWVVAAIGLAVGVGLYLTAIAATLLTFIILSWFSHLEDKAEILLQKQADEKASRQRATEDIDVEKSVMYCWKGQTRTVTKQEFYLRKVGSPYGIGL